MKVLLINGSPHPKGCTYRALKEITVELYQAGIEFEIENIGKDLVRGCSGCGMCKKSGDGHCVYTSDRVNEIIDKKSFDSSFPMLKRTFEKERLSDQKDDKFPLIYVITALYTTFILEEPIHPVGCEFPGSLKVEKRNGEFFCPVKDNQKDNVNAICHLCLAEQTPDI